MTNILVIEMKLYIYNDTVIVNNNVCLSLCFVRFGQLVARTDAMTSSYFWLRKNSPKLVVIRKSFLLKNKNVPTGIRTRSLRAPSGSRVSDRIFSNHEYHDDSDGNWNDRDAGQWKHHTSKHTGCYGISSVEYIYKGWTGMRNTFTVNIRLKFINYWTNLVFAWRSINRKSVLFDRICSASWVQHF